MPPMAIATSHFYRCLPSSVTTFLLSWPRCFCSTSSSRPWRMKRRSEEHTSELQSRLHLVCRLLLEKKKNIPMHKTTLEQAQRLASALPHDESRVLANHH